MELTADVTCRHGECAINELLDFERLYDEVTEHTYA